MSYQMNDIFNRDGVFESEKMIGLRTRRNVLLAASDWTQMPDVSLTPEKKKAWAEYRQSLRDLPRTTTDFGQEKWPVAPV
ncbi:tail fiber assembly protein [Chromobacterium violaceum]|uniref:tail fiber assembly protein n=1 Tax=Chromobacterium violaceum TaxID=536 RepID=UPI001E3418D4|nr:tail fiber assembly protein [Chromobacterium violaceum]